MTSTSVAKSTTKSRTKFKDKLLQFRVTDDDLRIIQAAAGHDSAAMAAWLRQTVLRRAAEMADTARGELRGRGYLPFSAGSVEIPPDQTIQVTARPQVSFCPDRLVVSQQTANFLIDDIIAAIQHIGVQTGSIPAEPFAANLDKLEVLEAELASKGVVKISLATVGALDGVGQSLRFPRCEPGTDIVITATNISKKPQRFFAVLFGAL